MVHPKRKSTKNTKPKKNVARETSPGENINELIAIEGDKLFQQMINEIDEYSMTILSVDGKILTCNRGAQVLTGYPANEIVGKNFAIFFDKVDRDAHIPKDLLKKALEKGKVLFEGWHIRKNGTRFWGSVMINSIYDKAGEAIGFFKLTRDLTEHKIEEDKFSNYVEELKIKNESSKQSEDLYHKMIMEVQDYAIILLDENGTILDWNKGAEKVKGYKPGEIIGKSFRLFYSKDDKEAKLPDRLLNEARTNGRVQHEGWRIRKDGSRFWGSVTITALHDDDDKVVGFSKVTRDLTERKIHEDRLNNYAEELHQKIEELRKSEERYHKMVAEIQDYAVILLNEKGDIENWNAGAEKIKGYTAKEILGKNFRIFYTKEDQKNKLPEKNLAQAAREGKAIHEGWRVRKDGTYFWGSIVITALHDASGKIMGFSKVTRDLSEKKKAEDLLQANAAQLDLKNKALERLNIELTSFTYVASHDLKEPLRKIQAFASMFENLKNVPDEGRHYLEKIKGSATRMQNLIEDLLSYSLISNDTSKIDKVDLNETLQAVKNDLEIVIKEKKAEINTTDKLPIIQGVSFQFHQLFLNLLSNSLKFSKPDQPPAIMISYGVISGPDIPGDGFDNNNRYHHISFIDNGIGFEPQYATKIFGAFQRLHAKTSFSGTGIGLAIVKKVVDNHNGIIVAEGVPDVGATFHLYLPYHQE